MVRFAPGAALLALVATKPSLQLMQLSRNNANTPPAHSRARLLDFEHLLAPRQRRAGRHLHLGERVCLAGACKRERVRILEAV